MALFVKHGLTNSAIDKPKLGIYGPLFRVSAASKEEIPAGETRMSLSVCGDYVRYSPRIVRSLADKMFG